MKYHVIDVKPEEVLETLSLGAKVTRMNVETSHVVMLDVLPFGKIKEGLTKDKYVYFIVQEEVVTEDE